jgi:hypothetical protein
LRRTYPLIATPPPKHYGRRTRSPESGGRKCFLGSILPRISLLSSSTAEAVG